MQVPPDMSTVTEKRVTILDNDHPPLLVLVKTATLETHAIVLKILAQAAQLRLPELPLDFGLSLAWPPAPAQTPADALRGKMEELRSRPPLAA